jgi:hypothetical protein
MSVPLLMAVTLTTAPPASATPALHAPIAFGRSIEPMAQYVAQVSCKPTYYSGTLSLGNLLVRTYRNTSFGGAYACGTDGTVSEHYDGRAIDWMNSVRNPTQAAQAASVISFLLGTDRYGNKFAMARRLGVMYLIWNNKIWGSWDGTWQNYRNCAATPSPALDSACHRNHMHISLSWDGALGKTSFFSGRVISTTNYGPCRPRDLNWAADYAVARATPCPRYPQVAAPARSSSTMQQLVAYSGAVMFPGMRGGPVLAVQREFGMAQSGSYDPATVAAVNRFKRAHRLPANGVLDVATWRVLLAAYRPR